MALLAAGLAALPLAAIRIVPTLEVAALSPRGQGLEVAAAVVGSAAPWALAAGLVLPGLEVLPVLSPTWVAYVGLVPLALAGYAAWQWRKKSLATPHHSRESRNPPPGQTVLLLVFGGVGLILACGDFTPLYPLLLEVPGFALFRDPTRWLILWVFAAALLAADGYDAWRASGGVEHATSRGDWWPRLALLVVVLIVAGHLVGTGALVFGRDLVLEQVGQPLAQRLADDPTRTFSAERYATTFAAYLTGAQRALDPRQLAVLGPLAGLVAAVWWFWSRQTWSRRGQPAVMFAVIIVPLLLFMWSRFPTVPSSAGAVELAQVATLPGLRDGTARVVSWKLRAAAYELNLATLAAQGNAPAATYALQRSGMTPNWGLAARVPQLGGYENLLSVRQAVLSAAIHSERTVPVRLPGEPEPHGWCQVRCGSGPPPQPQFAPEQLPQGLLEALAVQYLVLSRDALKKPHLDMHRWRPLGAGPNAGSMEGMDQWPCAAAGLPGPGRARRWLGRGSLASGYCAELQPAPDGGVGRVDSRFRGNDESGFSGQDTLGSARLTSDRPQRVAIAVEAAADAWLVLADAWFPGWTATLDGVSTPVLRANYLVPGGGRAGRKA